MTYELHAVPKPERQPKPLPKPRTTSRRSEHSGGHGFAKHVSLSRRSFIRRERCIATGKKTGEWVMAEPWMPPSLKALCPYKARVVAAHVDSRGAGHPDEANMVPLEWMLHQWQHQIGWRAFTGRLGMMSAKEIAARFETRYRAANANYQHGEAQRP